MFLSDYTFKLVGKNLSRGGPGSLVVVINIIVNCWWTAVRENVKRN